MAEGLVMQSQRGEHDLTPAAVAVVSARKRTQAPTAADTDDPDYWRADARAMIENTTNRDPLIHLAGSVGSGGFGGYVEQMEAAGQRQLVNSEMLPARINHGTQADMEKLGFVFGDPTCGDDLFRPVTLPADWKRQGSEHAMWSYVLDEHGRRRVSIFYKAAFYDRDAFMSLIGLGGYLWSVATGQEPLVLDDVWATREAVLAELDARIASEDEQAVTYGISHAKEAARYRRLRARVRKATR